MSLSTGTMKIKLSNGNSNSLKKKKKEKKIIVILGDSMVKHVKGNKMSNEISKCRVLVQGFGVVKVRC